MTGVMNKHQQHEVLCTIGVYHQLAADLHALLCQQKLFKNLPKRKVNVSVSKNQQTLTVEHNAILNLTMAVLRQGSHIRLLTREVDGQMQFFC
jgi:hypothetical protein